MTRGHILDKHSPRRLTRGLIRRAVTTYLRCPQLFFVALVAEVVSHNLVDPLNHATGLGDFAARALASGGATYWPRVAGWAYWVALAGVSSALLQPVVAHWVNHPVAGVAGAVRRSRRALPTVAALALTMILAALAGLVALVIPALVLTIRWLLVYPAMALDGLGARAALGRSWRLMAGPGKHLFGTWFLLVLAERLLVNIVWGPAVAGQVASIPFLGAVLVELPRVVLLPLWPIAATLAYRDLADAEARSAPTPARAA